MPRRRSDNYELKQRYGAVHGLREQTTTDARLLKLEAEVERLRRVIASLVAREDERWGVVETLVIKEQ